MSRYIKADQNNSRASISIDVNCLGSGIETRNHTAMAEISAGHKEAAPEPKMADQKIQLVTGCPRSSSASPPPDILPKVLYSNSNLNTPGPFISAL